MAIKNGAIAVLTDVAGSHLVGGRVTSIDPRSRKNGERRCRLMVL
jgi:hypothetical protein